MELPAKLLELVKDPEVRDVVVSGVFCAIDRGRGLEEATSPFTEAELEGELRQLAFEAGHSLLPTLQPSQQPTQ